MQHRTAFEPPVVRRRTSRLVAHKPRLHVIGRGMAAARAQPAHRCVHRVPIAVLDQLTGTFDLLTVREEHLHTHGGHYPNQPRQQHVLVDVQMVGADAIGSPEHAPHRRHAEGRLGRGAVGWPLIRRGQPEAPVLLHDGIAAPRPPHRAAEADFPQALDHVGAHALDVIRWEDGDGADLEQHALLLALPLPLEAMRVRRLVRLDDAGEPFPADGLASQVDGVSGRRRGVVGGDGRDAQRRARRDGHVRSEAKLECRPAGAFAAGATAAAACRQPCDTAKGARKGAGKDGSPPASCCPPSTCRCRGIESKGDVRRPSGGAEHEPRLVGLAGEKGDPRARRPRR